MTRSAGSPVPQKGVQMKRATKASWLQGDGDLRTEEVTDVPVPGESVLARGLPAAYSNQASSEALEMRQIGNNEQIATVNTARLEVLQFLHGVVEPQFDLGEVEAIASMYGPAFKKVVAVIDRLSGIDKEALENAQARFPAGSGSENGVRVEDATTAGGSRPDVPARVGARAGDDG